MADSVWKGRLAIGMVSIPVRLFKAARRERVRFHRVYRPAEMPRESEPSADEVEEAEPLPPPKRSLREVPKAVAAEPTALPEPEPVARVRHLAVADDTDEPVQ